MDKIVLTFCSNYNGNISVDMLVKSSNDYLGPPTGKELIYNDNKYFFMLSGTTSLPSTIYINDEAFQTVIMGYSNDSIKFRLNNPGFSTQNNMPFLDCFGAVKVEMNIDGTQYTTKAIDVLVSNTNINNSVMSANPKESLGVRVKLKKALSDFVKTFNDKFKDLYI